ncbi:MAG: hypothetical protein MUE51_08575 [Thermoleophilia bacterium]|nr:hypothetical protein [Thermoleophilia bacterium]
MSLGETALGHVEDLVAGICRRGAPAGEGAVLRLPDGTPLVVVLIGPERASLLEDCELTLLPCAGEACGRGTHEERLLVVLSGQAGGLALELDPDGEDAAGVLRQFLFDGEFRALLIEPSSCEASVAEFPLGREHSAALSGLLG